MAADTCDVDLAIAEQSTALLLKNSWDVFMTYDRNKKHKCEPF